jgi:glycosyltransferase involved in cell wall biosynthesis
MQLIIDSKSRWTPQIRREHALAQLARAAGHEVTFIERPVDVRALGSAPLTWFADLRGRASSAGPGVRVLSRSTLAPAHRGRLAESLEGQLLQGVIRDAGLQPAATIVTTVPWHWPTVGSTPVGRRVLDVADDWGSLIPERARRIAQLCARAAAEADAIVVASERLASLFGGRDVAVVRNGADHRLVHAPLSPPPGRCRLVYVGTLSERFDAPLVGALLDSLAGWTLELYGSCAYARRGGAPGRELAALLRRADGRARWLGPVPRERLPAVLDRGDVLLLPNRGDQGRGQDSMKIYDYAARGRPIVGTYGTRDGISELPPHVRLGGDADELAALVLDAADERPQDAEERRMWAARQTWGSRWANWSRALFGGVPPEPAPIDPEHDPERGVSAAPVEVTS